MNRWGFDGRVDAHSGYPITLQGNQFSDSATGERFFSGVDQIQGRPLYISGSKYPGGRMINGGPEATTPAFVAPTGAISGNAPRNQLRGFGSYQINADIRRDLRMYRNSTLQLRIEAYNLSDHPDFGYIDPWISNSLFGKATLLLNQSFGGVGSQYEPGAPRSFQFSAKFHF